MDIPGAVTNIIVAAILAFVGYIWNELNNLIKQDSINQIRIKHLEEDNLSHKENHKGLYEKLYTLVSELKDDISDLKETISKNKI